MPTTSQPKVKILVANLFSKAMPGRVLGAKPVKLRTGFEYQILPSLGHSADLTGLGYSSSVVYRVQQAILDPFVVNPSPRATGDVEVTDNTFQGTLTSLYVGPYELVCNRDYEVGGAAAATATNIATAISNLPGYSATPAGAVVTVEGPLGAVGDRLRFEAAYRGSARNFTFTYVAKEGTLDYAADDPLLPFEILP